MPIPSLSVFCARTRDNNKRRLLWPAACLVLTLSPFAAAQDAAHGKIKTKKKHSAAAVPLRAAGQGQASAASGVSGPSREQAGEVGPEVRTRREAVHDLARSTDSSAVPQLLSSLDDTDPYVRGGAAEHLGRSKDGRAYEALMGLLKSEDKNTRWGAIEGLGQLGDARAAAALIPLLKHQDSATRWKAAESLGKLGGGEAVDALILALDDSFVYVACAAADGLGSLGDARALAALKAKLGAKEPLRAHCAAAIPALEKGR